MLGALWLIPALPLLGFLLLTLGGRRLSRTAVAVIGAGAAGLSAGVALLIGGAFVVSPPSGDTFRQTLWTWMSAGGFTADIAFCLDRLSLVYVLVVTVVGFLILLYSTAFMAEDEGQRRFFANMNLFVGAMLTLVLADNLPLLYVGWEGVGLCSYLLIGHWYKDPANGRAARKAFLVTRVGDTALIAGLLFLFTQLGTLQIEPLMRCATEQWPVGSSMAVIAALLLLGGAIGKSAQLPLQTWLPDAMAGPTPVSALIHAATMVTAGVYLIARTHAIFVLAPSVMLLVAIIGAATLLYAGCAALTQTDIKRVLAYSTISQIGYMFLALGAGAWSAAIFHFVTHAFFKSLLFLGAGVVIAAQHEEHNMFKMGGLRKQLPVAFWTFLVGGCSLAALPLVTAGFYSKDMILAEVWGRSAWLWAAGLLGALLTSLYTFRMIFLTFFGPVRQPVEPRSERRMNVPLIVLAVLSILGGFLPVTHFLRSVLPATVVAGGGIIVQVVAGLVSLAGVYLAYVLYLRRRASVTETAATPAGEALRRFWLGGWGFDWLYGHVIVAPYLWLARMNEKDVVDRPYAGIAWVSDALHRALSRTQTGRVRWYAAAIAVGALIIFAITVFLCSWSG